ncbi:hypothetical protein STRCI_003986 [Streptomyces cinnabarinus]|uniref:Secreted protein n=1 Tax=Streptomyces cinnabarinus TaxID=67287 RepID=A0ABY7KF55_9ACTN|nr:hypothetical protein [Streptomyces cinnabarinus]WAZ22703.1 hypothetical protein STRCI_003986 [Streptomyces cinnabarinus]
MSTARRLPRSRAWLRGFVLLLALFVPAAPAGVQVAPVAVVAEVVEYDVVDAAARPVTARRTPRTDAVPPRLTPHPRTASPSPHPHTPPTRRSVVLRC